MKVTESPEQILQKIFRTKSFYPSQDVELMISFECDNGQFSNSLRNFLISNYPCIEITSHCYSLKKKINMGDFIDLKNKINSLFTNFIEVKRGKPEKIIVKMITPHGNQLNVFTICLE